MSKFSVYLKELIRRRGEPIARIAKNAGLERTSIHKALKDERILSYQALRQLIHYLQLTLPEVRELNQYYEMLLQGEGVYRTREAICDLLADLSQLHFSSQDYLPKSEVPMEVPKDLPSPGLIYGRPQIEAAFQMIFQWETVREGAKLSLYLPPENRIGSGLLHLWKSGRGFYGRQLVAFMPERFGEDTRQENLKLLRRLLPLALVSRGQYFAYYYFEQNTALVNVDPMPYFVITPHYLIHLDHRMSVARFETAPDLIALYEKQFSHVLEECQILTSYSKDPEQVLESYMQATSLNSYYTIMLQPCLGHYYTRERIAEHVRQEVPGREQIIELSDLRMKRLRELSGEYYTIFTEEGLRTFALDGITVDFPPEIILPVKVRARREILCEFRKDIIEGRIKGCIADIEKLAIPPYLTLTCDVKFGLHIYATQSFIDGAYACNLHIEESSIGQAFCEFIRALPQSKYVYSTERTLEILDELIGQIPEDDEGGSEKDD